MMDEVIFQGVLDEEPEGNQVVLLFYPRSCSNAYFLTAFYVMNILVYAINKTNKYFLNLLRLKSYKRFFKINN